MKYKYILSGIIFSSISYTARAQQEYNYAGAIEKEAYFNNPRGYLSELKKDDLKTDILLDYNIYSDYIFEFNGKSKVKVGEHHDFESHYKQIRQSFVDTNALPRYKIIEQLQKYDEPSDAVHYINVLDFDYERINEDQIDYAFRLGNEKLQHAYSASNQFKESRVVNFSLGSPIILGQNVQFKLDKNFFFDNHHDKAISYIDIDFGNGSGKERWHFGKSKSIYFPEVEKYYEAKITIAYRNKSTQSTEKVSAHFSFYIKRDVSANSGRAYSGSFNGHHTSFYYPQITAGTFNICREIRVSNQDLEYTCDVLTTEVIQPYSLKVDIMLHHHNKSGKLRKPFIMVDGFDPGNQRNIYRTNVSSDALPRDKDTRGLYEMLNGQPSPWSNTNTPTGFIAELQERGFDIVFIDFTEGAGDLVKNAQKMRELFNNVLNAAQYRDNKTQEHILVGPSMGGLITRIMLTEMEKANEEHFVKQWISFDSPHKGANVPLAVQHLLDFMVSASVPNSHEKLAKINSIAAKSMLLHHYSRRNNSQGNAHQLFVELQELLKENNYPISSLNYAISNGGEELIYEGRQQILKFDADLRGQISNRWAKAFISIFANNLVDDLDANDLKFTGYNWDQEYGSNYSQTFQGTSLFTGTQEVKYRDQFNIDNAPGGWSDFTYTANYNELNTFDQPSLDSEDSKTRTINTFIPVCSAFGITPDKDSVMFYPSQFTNCNDYRSGKIMTPFDDILGMEENEEHVRISPETRNHVFKEWIDPENQQTTRPVIRKYKSYNQVVSKPVGFIVTDSIAFAKENNGYKFKGGADSKIQSGRNITFHPGFHAETGSKIMAYIDTDTKISHRLKSGQQQFPEETYSQGSPYKNKTYDYSVIEEQLKPAEVSQISATIFPNPGSSEMNVLMEKVADKTAEIRVYNMTGMLMYSTSTEHSQLSIDVNDWANGVYLVEIRSSGNTETLKYTKI